MTNCSPRPRMRWNGAIGAIERCKRASTACALRSRSRHELHLICGEKPKAKGVIRPFKPYMRHVQDESNPVPSLQSQPVLCCSWAPAQASRILTNRTDLDLCTATFWAVVWCSKACSAGPLMSTIQTFRSVNGLWLLRSGHNNSPFFEEDTQY